MYTICTFSPINLHLTTRKHLDVLLQEFHQLRTGKDSLLALLEEAELPEAIYNSNAIENSTLTLDETEKILLHQEIPPYHTQREFFEAINLARVTEYLNEKVRTKESLNKQMILLIHQTLLSHIDENIAGRFRHGEEYVRVGRHIAPSPAHVSSLMANALRAYDATPSDILQCIVAFHLEFERIHPFCDGNGRVGRALMQFQLKSHRYPPIIIRDKEKRQYYASLQAYDDDRSTKNMEHIVVVLLKESLHKRIAYLRSDEILLLSEMAREDSLHSAQSLANAAKKQSMPAFRERGKWKIGRQMFHEWRNRKVKMARQSVVY